jgi:predicted nicotinamide N-methyase
VPDLDEGRRSVWAHLWPSGIVLAEQIAGELAPRVRGRDVIELGCGLGAVGLAAARAGGVVTMTDGEPEALALAAANAAANQLDVRLCLLAWSAVPAALVGGFDLVVAADVTYDPAQVAPLVATIEALLRADGEAWIADPSRIAIADLAVRPSLAIDVLGRHPPPDRGSTSDDSGGREIVVYRVRRRADRAGLRQTAPR